MIQNVIVTVGPVSQASPVQHDHKLLPPLLTESNRKILKQTQSYCLKAILKAISR